MKVNWKKKLTSRKFWAAIVGFVTPLLESFGMKESQTAQITCIIMAGATLIAYIIGEGLIDSKTPSTQPEKEIERSGSRVNTR